MDNSRIEGLCKTLKAEGMAAVLVCPSEELRVLMGVTPKMCWRFQGLFIKDDGGMFYVCNRLYTDEVDRLFDGKVKIYTWWDGESMTDRVAKAFEENGIPEGALLGAGSAAHAFNVLDIAEACGVTFKNGRDALNEARIVKTEDEMNSLRKAAQIADLAMMAMVGHIQPGMNEKEIKEYLLETLSMLGGKEPKGIVASGPNSSYPHYMGGIRVIEERDIIVLDFGCTVNGMYADITRTLFVGEPTEEQKKVYEIVRRANEAGEAAAVTGAWIPDIDKAARGLITDEGYGEYFTTRLGHGIGYMNHEAPDIKKNNERRLKLGMAFSIEPGIYLGGNFGVRIEDILIATPDGHEILNKLPKEMVIIK